jgi:hypothetical protein
MTDYTELKRLAEGCRDQVIRSHGWVGMIEDADLLGRDEKFLKECSPEAVLALIAENEQRGKLIGHVEQQFYDMQAERDQFKAENEVARMRIKELDLLFGRYILAMRSALIEEEHGKGPAAAMEWIYNSLAGPGQLPPEGETASQAYFDREIVAVDRGMEEVMAFHEKRRAAMSKAVQP